MKKKNKPIILRLWIIPAVLLSVVSALLFADVSYGKALAEMQNRDGAYLSVRHGIYLTVPDRAQVVEKSTYIELRSDDGILRIETVKTETQGIVDFLEEYSAANKYTTQIISSPLDSYTSFYRNGRTPSTEKGLAKMVQSDRALLVTTSDADLFESLNNVASELKYIQFE